MLGCIPADFRFVCNKGNYVGGNIVSGQSITPGNNNTKGSWGQIASSNDITKDVYLLTLNFAGGASNNSQARCMFMDLGIDENGGSNYSIKIRNMIVPQNFSTSTSILTGNFEIPIFIKKGSSVALRFQCKATSSANYAIFSTFYGEPYKPEIVPKGIYFDNIGEINESTTLGTTIADNFIDGTTGRKGLWQLVGQARRNYWGLIFGAQFNSSALSNNAIFFDVAVAPRHGEFRKIASDLIYITGTIENVMTQNINVILNKIPNGSYLYVRGSAVGTIPSNSSNCSFIGVG